MQTVLEMANENPEDGLPRVLQVVPADAGIPMAVCIDGVYLIIGGRTVAEIEGRNSAEMERRREWGERR